MIIDANDYFAHYGVVRRSGRYPYGSGDNLELRTSATFLDYVDYLKRILGLTDKEVATDLGISTTELRAKKSIAKNEKKQHDISYAQKLKDKGYSNVAIGGKMGINESSVRALLAPGAKDKADLLTATANMIKSEVDAKTFLDIGTGTEKQIQVGNTPDRLVEIDLGDGETRMVNLAIGVSDTRLKTAVAMLEDQGYKIHYLKVQQLGTGKDTTVKVLTKDDVSYSEVYANRDKLQQIAKFSDDGGRTYNSGNHKPLSVDPSRVEVKYNDDGGNEADGMIYVRPGVEDLSLGGATYAQVRVQVGDGHYLKGMAVAKEGLPEGVDIQFNTVKDNTGNKLDAMKPMTGDPDLPFGAITRPLLKDPGTPNETVISALNIVNEEGNWSEWSKNLSTQMLSKQSPLLAKEQLRMTQEARKKEYDEINALTNPTVKRKLLEEFADGTDAAAVHLKAASLPRQGSHVILPVSSLSPLEVYAPNYNDGESVVLVRYPHGGTFEIPELRVNNKHPESKKLLGNAQDAIGIHHTVAERLSGADFDGDTVLVIPNNQNKVSHQRPLEQLKNFDPQRAYPGYPGMKTMTNTQTEMGMVSNLITDMTIKGGNTADIARAVKHSMVVIDAEKKGLDYKKSYTDNGIKALKEKYQDKGDGSRGASTLISRAKSRTYIPDEKPRTAAKGGPVDPKTGKKVFEETGKTHYLTGEPIRVRRKALEVTDNAHDLSSGTRIEQLYADHSNTLKGIANQARKSAIETPRATYDPSAKKAYQGDVDTINAKLNLALRNRPLERQAQVIANAAVKMKRDAIPDMDKATLKKLRSVELEKARVRTGAKKQRITLTPREWEAVQAGAISDSKLSTILANADMDSVRALATPRNKVLMTSAKQSRAASMFKAGATRAEVASQLGVSLSTLDESMNA